MRSSLLRFLVFLACVCGAHAQQNWQWLNMLPASSGWKDVAHGNGVYVAIGGDGTIISSADAITWTVRRMPTGNMALNAIAFADGRFVAVGMGGATTGAALVLASTDGVAWTVNDSVNTTINAQLRDVTYGNGTWVISGASQNRVLSSTDGLTWTVRAAGANTGQIAFGGGKFVALTNNNKAITSSDGITWTSVTIDASTSMFFEGITYGNNKFVVGGSSNFKAISYTSADGTTWTAGTVVADSNGGGTWLAFGNNTFLMGGGGSFDLLSSADGAVWTKRTPALPESRSSSTNSVRTEGIGGVGAANNLLFCFGIYGGLTTSTDGVTWTRRGSGTAHDITGLVHDGTRFVGVGTGGTVITSTDGVTWTAASTNFTGWFDKLAYGNGRYVATSMDGLWHSTDLATWTRVANTAFNQMSGGVIRANDRFIAAANGISLGLWVSTDGATWTVVPRPSGANGGIYGLAGGGGKFLMALGGPGVTPKLWISSDATTWTDVTPAGFTGTPDSAAYANNRFVVFVGNTAWTSSDGGTTWTSGALPAANFTIVTDVMAIDGKFIARKFPAYVTSDDGLTWTDIENSVTPGVEVLSAVAHGGYVYIAGGGGAILRGNLVGAAAPQTLTATVAAGATVQWQRNGANISGATSANYSIDSVTPDTAGVYTAVVTSGSTTTLQSFVVGATTTEKVVGTADEFPDITHQNGNVYDQLLLASAAASFTADATQITRLSFVDMSDDIVQVEFSGAGTVSIVLEGATTPAPASNYNQDTVDYLKGHATIVITGADETSNLTIFSVGSITAVNQSLFKSGVDYDGYADVAAVAIQSSNGKFGMMRSGNTSFWNTKGLTGLYAPGVTFENEIFIHDINARETATPVFVIAGAKETRLTGGDLKQDNDRAVVVAGLTELKLTAGSDSHGNLIDAQTNQGRLERNGVDVTAEIIP